MDIFEIVQEWEEWFKKAERLYFFWWINIFYAGLISPQNKTQNKQKPHPQVNNNQNCIIFTVLNNKVKMNG